MSFWYVSPQKNFTKNFMNSSSKILQFWIQNQKDYNPTEKRSSLTIWEVERMMGLIDSLNVKKIIILKKIYNLQMAYFWEGIKLMWIRLWWCWKLWLWRGKKCLIEWVNYWLEKLDKIMNIKYWIVFWWKDMKRKELCFGK